MVMSPTATGTTNDCAGEGQWKDTWLTSPKDTVEFHNAQSCEQKNMVKSPAAVRTLARTGSNLPDPTPESRSETLFLS
jgi:hypothetical protein